MQHSVGYETEIQPLLGFLSTLPKGTPFFQSIEFNHVETRVRIKEGKIVEHWDSQEKILPKEQWRNSGKL